MFELIGDLLWLLYLACVLGTLALYVVWVYERRNHPEDALPDGGTLATPVRSIVAVFLETLAIYVLALTYPLRLFYDFRGIRPKEKGVTPVMLVHGYGANSASMMFLHWMLLKLGWPNVFVISYTPPTANARGLARQVSDHAERIMKACEADRIDIVCHSMGGVLTRYALINLDLAGKVDVCVTLGSPHRGSRVAGLVPAMGSAAQMRHDSSFVREVAADGDTPGEVRFYSIWSEFDNFVLPERSALISGNAENLHVPYHGHCSLLYSPMVARQVDQCLRHGRGEYRATAVDETASE
jgi:triacylglycerol esterase/lipase EstA (alpha/beta hydrolase family)